MKILAAVPAGPVNARSYLKRGDLKRSDLKRGDLKRGDRGRMVRSGVMRRGKASVRIAAGWASSDRIGGEFAAAIWLSRHGLPTMERVNRLPAAGVG